MAELIISKQSHASPCVGSSMGFHLPWSISHPAPAIPTWHLHRLQVTWCNLLHRTSCSAVLSILLHAWVQPLHLAFSTILDFSSLSLVPIILAIDCSGLQPSLQNNRPRNQLGEQAPRNLTHASQIIHHSTPMHFRGFNAKDPSASFAC